MRNSTKNMYCKIFGYDIVSEKDELSLDDIVLLLKYFDNKLNFNNDYISNIINTFDKQFPNRKYILIFLQNIYTHFIDVHTCSIITTSFWISRGYTNAEAVEYVKNEQRKRSNLCEEYWFEKGFSKKDAHLQISKIQKNYGERTLQKYSKEEWRKYSPRCKEYWINHGYSEKDAIKEVSKMCSLASTSCKYSNPKKYKEICKKRANTGEKNGMFGKPSPKNAGRGISGYYKNFYFRSLLEYFYIKQLELENAIFNSNDNINLSKTPEKNKIAIKYKYHGVIHTYFPDFILNNDTIIEVKNTYGFTTNKWKCKLYALQKYCVEHNMKYEILSEKKYQTR